MANRLLSLKKDGGITWLSLTNNDIGISIEDLTNALLKSSAVCRKVSCHAGFLGSLTNYDLQLLIHTIAKLANLEDLWLALPPKQAFQSSSILRVLLNSPHCCSRLRKLTFRGMDDAACHVLAKALRKSEVALTELQIRGAVATTTGNNDNNNNAPPTPPSKVTRRGILAMAHMLQVNTSLQRVDLKYKGLDTGCCRALAKALSVNHTLVKLELSSPSNSKVPPSPELMAEGYNALVQTMRDNYTLQHLNTEAQGGHKNLLELFAKLNRTGARTVLQNRTGHTTLNDVLGILQGNIHDASALYELLSTLPAVWDPFKAHTKGLEGEEPIVMKKKAPLKSPPPIAETFAKAPIAPAAAAKPVMSRWKEDIFSSLEQEKFKTFKRWTPTVIDDDGAATATKKPAVVKTKKRNSSVDKISYYHPAACMNVPAEACPKPKPRVRRSTMPAATAKTVGENADQDKKVPAASVKEERPAVPNGAVANDSPLPSSSPSQDNGSELQERKAKADKKPSASAAENPPASIPAADGNSNQRSSTKWWMPANLAEEAAMTQEREVKADEKSNLQSSVAVAKRNQHSASSPWWLPSKDNHNADEQKAVVEEEEKAKADKKPSSVDDKPNVSGPAAAAEEKKAWWLRSRRPRKDKEQKAQAGNVAPVAIPTTAEVQGPERVSPNQERMAARTGPAVVPEISWQRSRAFHTNEGTSSSQQADQSTGVIRGENEAQGRMNESNSRVEASLQGRMNKSNSRVEASLPEPIPSFSSLVQSASDGSESSRGETPVPVTVRTAEAPVVGENATARGDGEAAKNPTKQGNRKTGNGAARVLKDPMGGVPDAFGILDDTERTSGHIEISASGSSEEATGGRSSRRPRKRIRAVAKKVWGGTKSLIRGFRAKQ